MEEFNKLENSKALKRAENVNIYYIIYFVVFKLVGFISVSWYHILWPLLFSAVLGLIILIISLLKKKKNA